MCDETATDVHGWQGMQCGMPYGSKDKFEPQKEKVMELKWPIQKFRDKMEPLVKLEGWNWLFRQIF